MIDGTCKTSERVFNFVFYSRISYRTTDSHSAVINLLKQLLQLSNNGITNLNSGVLAANVASTDTSLNDVADSLLNDAGLIEHVERVLHHHSDGQNSSDGVNNTLSSDIGSGT